MLDNYSTDIVASQLIGCEAWLNSSILDNETMPDHIKYYKVFRKDRKDGYGGVLIGISSTLSSKLHVQTLTHVEKYVLSVQLQLLHGQELIIIGA